MPRFTAPMEQRLRGLEEEYDMSPERKDGEEDGMFGPRGFFGNIRDYYQTDSWGSMWRNFFGRQERSRTPTIYPSWGRENIRTLQDIMREG